MIFHARIGAGLLVLAHFFMAPAASGQPAGQSGPQVEGVDLRGLSTVTRRVDKTYPISDSPSVSIANKYGSVSVSSWSNPLVQVVAHIRVGADSQPAAERFAQSIDVTGNHVGDKVEVRTVYPEVDASAKIGYTVNLEIKVPTATSVTLENVFGDCDVRDLKGDLAVDSRYGVVNLRNLSGQVRVRAKGSFPLTARNLRKGGTFTLRSTQATLSKVSGKLDVNNYLGTVELRELGKTIDADITCESGPIHVYLPEDPQPHLEASAHFGSIVSDFVWRGETWGDVTRLASEVKNEHQHLALHGSFDTIYIHRDSPKPAAEPLVGRATEPVKQVLTSAIPVGDATSLLIDAMAGNLEIVGVDDPSQVIVQATRFIRINNRDNAKMALEGLAFRLNAESETIRVESRVQEDLEALGCSEYRVDLQVKLPKGLLARVIAQQGNTTVRNAGGGVVLEQGSGTVTLVETAGSLDVTNESGDVTIQQASGPVKADVKHGNLRIEKAGAQIDATCAGGKTIIDTPQAGVKVTHTSGDVRIIALEGIQGDMEIRATDGNVSMAIPDTADASLFLNANGGTVYSSVAMNGTIEKQSQSFQGRMNEGTHRIIVETQQGNIVLD